MTKKLRPVTPGDILLEEFLKPLEMSQNKLARELDVPAARINSIIKNTRRITVDMAIRLGRFFNTGPELWLNVQQCYDLKIAELTIEPEIYRRVVPFHNDHPNATTA